MWRCIWVGDSANDVFITQAYVYILSIHRNTFSYYISTAACRSGFDKLYANGTKSGETLGHQPTIDSFRLLLSWLHAFFNTNFIVYCILLEFIMFPRSVRCRINRRERWETSVYLHKLHYFVIFRNACKRLAADKNSETQTDQTRNTHCFRTLEMKHDSAPRGRPMAREFALTCNMGSASATSVCVYGGACGFLLDDVVCEYVLEKYVFTMCKASRIEQQPSVCY